MTSFKVKSIVAVAALAAAASASAGEILIVSGLSGSSEISTTTEVLDNLKSLHTAVGNNVTVSDLLPADLSGFKQVWDIRFDQALNASAQSEYSSFLQAGGGLFLMGENAGFMSRNDSILSLISSLGGGAIGFADCSSSVQKTCSSRTVSISWSSWWATRPPCARCWSPISDAVFVRADTFCGCSTTVR